MSWSFALWSWPWFLAAAILLATAWLVLTRHQHKYQVTGVSYPSVPGGMAGVFSATAPFITQVLYVCPCQQPRSAISAELGGHWVLDQVKGLVRVDEPAEGGDAAEPAAKVTTLVLKGPATVTEDK